MRLSAEFQRNFGWFDDDTDRSALSLSLSTNSQNSQILNEARLKVLQARQSYVNNVLEEALENLVKATKDEEMYKKVLQKLIEQVKLLRSCCG